MFPSLIIAFRRKKGKFSSGALVSIVDESNKEIARRLVNLNSEELAKVIGQKNVGGVIHRDDLVILSKEN